MQEPALVVAGAATDSLPEAVVQAFDASLRGELLRPDNVGYERTRQVWNGLIDKRPALIARCQGVADVIAAVNLARTHDLLVSVRCGGHNVAGTAVCDGGLMIDLSAMRAVRVNPRARTADVQGGAIWADVDRETQAFGLAVSGGVVSTTGVAGLTLAGGYGWLRNRYGLTCDMLRSVDIVTADGELLTASAEQNADLFWALRGGGGNFGIVTNFEFDLAPLGTEVVFCAVMYAIDQARRVVSAWRKFVDTVPDAFTTDCDLWAVPSLPGFPAELWGKSVVIVAGVYCGDLAEGERFIEPLRRLAEPLLDLSGRWPFLNVQQAFDPVFPHGEHLHYWKSLYLDCFDEEVWNLVLEHFARKPSPRTLVATRFIGGAAQRVAADATAFGDRSAQFLISIDSTWEDAEATEANIAWTRDLWAALQPFSGGRTYFSFAGLMEEGDALVRTTFGANYARLAQIKRRYDPDNFFRLNQNIKPAGDLTLTPV